MTPVDFSCPRQRKTGIVVRVVAAVVAGDCRNSRDRLTVALLTQVGEVPVAGAIECTGRSLSMHAFP